MEDEENKSTEEKAIDKYGFNSLKPEKELLKHQECSQSKGNLYEGAFYLCSQVEEKDFIICAHCAKNCHKGHKHKKVPKTDNLKCKCAANGHEFKLKLNKKNECFYQTFFNYAPNFGYFYLGKPENKKTYCAVCANFCRVETPMERNMKTQVKIEEDKKCICPLHKTESAIDLKNDFMEHRRFSTQLKNFSYNLFFKSQIINELTKETLINALKDCQTKRQSYPLAPKDFLENQDTEAVVELFYIFSMYFRNKYFYLLEDIFDEAQIEECFNIIKFSTVEGMDNFFQRNKNQIYLANMLFSIDVRHYHIKNGNKYNILTIQNMNVEQRKKFIHDFRVNSTIRGRHEKIIQGMLKCYEKLINEYFSNKEVMTKIRTVVLPLMLKAFKYVIKYNMISEENAERFFMILNETIQINNEFKGNMEFDDDMLEQNNIKKVSILQNTYEPLPFDYVEKIEVIEPIEKENENKGRENDRPKRQDSFVFERLTYSLIMKSIFYYLLYQNDKMVLEHLDNESKDFEFVINSESKIFQIIQSSFYTTLGQYDSFIERLTIEEKENFHNVTNCVLKLMCAKHNNFYVKSLRNLKLISDEKVKLDETMLKDVKSKINRLHAYSRYFFIYRMDFQTHAIEGNKLFKDLENYFRSEIQYIELDKKYEMFLREKSDNEMKKLKEIQEVLGQTQLITVLDEYISINGSGGALYLLNATSMDEIIPDGHRRKFILKLLYLYMIYEPQNATLVMNLSARSLCSFFIFIYNDFFDFLERLMEVMFSTEYYYANYNFFMKIAKEIKRIMFSYYIGNDFAAVYTRYIQLYHQLLIKIKDNNTQVIEFVPLFQDIVKLETNNEENNAPALMIKDFLEHPNQHQSVNKTDKNYVENLFISYIDFMGTLYSTEISKYMSDIRISDNITYNNIIDIYISKIQEGNYEFNPKLLYPILKYYIEISLPFRLNLVCSIDILRDLLSDLNLPSEQENTNNILKLNENKYVEYINKYVDVIKIRRMNAVINPISIREISQEIDKQIKKFYEVIKFVDNIFMQFEDILNYYIHHKNQFSSILSLKVILYKFFDNICVRTSYYLMKVLEIYSPYLQGEKFENIFKFIFHFVQITLLFYDKIDSFYCRERSHEEFSKTVDLKKYERLTIYTSLTKEEYLNLKDLFIKMQDLKYYAVMKYMEIYNNVLRIITKPQDEEEKKEEENKHFKYIDSLIEKYKEVLQEDNKFTDFENSNNLTAPIDTKFFRLFKNDFVSSFDLAKIKHLTFFISIMEGITDVAYSKDQAEKDKFSSALQRIANDTDANNLIMVMTFSCVNEVLTNFILRTEKQCSKKSFHCYINQKITRFFQILCEGNNLAMKKYLFEFIGSVTEPPLFSNFKYQHIAIIEHISSDEVRQIHEDLSRKDAFNKGKKINLNVLNKDKEKDKDNKSDNESSYSKSAIGKKRTSIANTIESFDEQSQINSRLLSFFNIISNNMKLLLLIFNKEIIKILPPLFKNNKEKIYKGCIEMFGGYKDLMIEMIQGHRFYEDIFSKSEMKELQGEGSSFYHLCSSISVYNKDDSLAYDPFTEGIKLDFLQIIQNIVCQDYLFDLNKPNFLFEYMDTNRMQILVGLYMVHVYFHFVEDKILDSAKSEKLDKLNLTKNSLDELVKKYRRKAEMKNDSYLKMAYQLFLILTTLKERYQLSELNDFFALKNQNFKEEEETKNNLIENDINNNSKNGTRENEVLSTRMSGINLSQRIRRGETQYGSQINLLEKMDLNEEKEIRISPEDYREEILLGIKFLSQILKKVEIFRKIPLVDGGFEEKTYSVYFQEIPETSLIDNTSIERLNQSADRTNRITKLRSILNMLPDYLHEIDYKFKNYQDTKYEFLFDFDFNYADIFNCLVCLFLNIMFIYCLNTPNIQFYRNLINILETSLVGINICFISLFVFTKYPLYKSLLSVKLSKELENKDLMYYFRVYIWDSLLYNKETSLINLVIFAGILVIMSQYDALFIGIQVIIISKFVPTIQDILYAFYSRADQLMSMIFFLAILMHAFATYDYNFLKEEFALTQEDGTVLHACSTLLECYITLFNNGVRSGGGIADILPEREFHTFLYFERYIHDMIFFVAVILMLMNMINGVIVSAFGQIREETTTLEDDVKNVCFICGARRDDLEEEKIDYEEHIRKHNLKTYVRYLISLLLTEQSDMNEDQYYVSNCLQSDNVDFFPKHVSNDEDNEDEDDEED